MNNKKGIYIITLDNKIQTKNKNDNENSIADFNSLEDSIIRCNEIKGSKVFHIFKQIEQPIFINNSSKTRVYNIAIEVYPENKSNSAYNIVISKPIICDKEDEINKGDK